MTTEPTITSPVVQYYTNNDGSLQGVLTNPDAPMELREAVADALGVAVPDVSRSGDVQDSGTMTDPNNPTGPPVGTDVFVGKDGAYYKNVGPKDPSDSLIEYPSAGLLKLLDAKASIPVEIARDMLREAVATERGTGGV